MNDFVIDFLSDEKFYLVVSFGFCLCLVPFFLGYFIRLILNLLNKI